MLPPPEQSEEMRTVAYDVGLGSHLFGALEMYRALYLYPLPQADQYQAQAEIDLLIKQLLTNVQTDKNDMLFVMPQNAKLEGSDANIVRSHTGTLYGCSSIIYNSTAAVNDILYIDTNVYPGKYYYNCMMQAQSNCGMYRVFYGDDESDNIDTYRTTTGIAWDVGYITVAASNFTRVGVRCVGKNASSSGYFNLLYQLTLTRLD